MGCVHSEPYLGRLTVLAKPETLLARKSIAWHNASRRRLLQEIGYELPVLQSVCALSLSLYSDTPVDKGPISHRVTPSDKVGFRFYFISLDHGAAPCFGPLFPAPLK